MSYPPYGGGAPGGYSPAGGYPPTAQSGHAQGVPFQQPQQVMIIALNCVFLMCMNLCFYDLSINQCFIPVFIHTIINKY